MVNPIQYVPENEISNYPIPEGLEPIWEESVSDTATFLLFDDQGKFIAPVLANEEAYPAKKRFGYTLPAQTVLTCSSSNYKKGSRLFGIDMLEKHPSEGDVDYYSVKDFIPYSRSPDRIDTVLTTYQVYQYDIDGDGDDDVFYTFQNKKSETLQGAIFYMGEWDQIVQKWITRITENSEKENSDKEKLGYLYKDIKRLADIGTEQTLGILYKIVEDPDDAYRDSAREKAIRALVGSIDASEILNSPEKLQTFLDAIRAVNEPN